jgi:formate dehydrogenase subunit gamma
MTRPKGTLIRNPTITRINHWITAACFVLLTLSGLAMFHPLLFAIHPWIGLVLVVSYAGMIVQFWRDNLWTKTDLEWTLAIGRVLANEEESVPEVGRFNAGQKFVFWSMALLIPVLLFTGILIWDYYFETLTSVGTQRAALLIHSLAAIAAIIIWVIHVYAAIWVRGSMRAMTQGYVTPGWAWRHHRKWFRALAATGSPGPEPHVDDNKTRK